MTNRIVVFDVLGPMYHYDKEGWNPNKGAAGPLIKLLREYDLPMATGEEEVESERKLVCDMGYAVQTTDGFVERVMQHGERPVIISAGHDDVIRYALEQSVRKYVEATGDTVTAQDLIRSEDIHCTSLPVSRSKKKAATWASILGKHYPGATVGAVYEDTPANLVAAMQGLKTDNGYHVTFESGKQQTSLEGLAVTRGNMRDFTR